MLDFKTLSIALIAAATTGATSIPAQASIDRGTTVQTRIDVRDLKTDAGAMRVYEKLRKTAIQKCSFHNTVTPSIRKSVEACAADLLTDFIKSAGDEKLTRIHAAST